MASLEKLAGLLNVELPSNKDRDTYKKSVGLKRRSWISENDKGSIDTVYEPGLSTVSIDRVDEPFIDKGSIDRVNKQGLSGLRGNPLKLIRFLYQISYTEQDKVSRKITLSEIMQSLNISRDSARTALRFLLKNKLIERAKNKVGKNGWSQYLIKNSLFCEIQNAIHDGGLQPFTIVENYTQHKGSISSSNIKIITTTELEEAYQQMNLEPLQAIGFCMLHVEQLAKKGIHPDIIQESIYHFAFALDRKNYDDPLNVFMGVLRRGQRWHEANYESPQDRALRELIEAKKAEKDKREAMISQWVELEFPDWLKNLSEEERRTIVPANVTLQAAATSLLRKHFIELVLLPKLGAQPR